MALSSYKNDKLTPKSPFLTPHPSGSARELGSESHFMIASAGRSTSTVEPEHKSTLVGCTANLITAIVGAGIIGLPYAMKETGLIAGVLLILISGALGCKSLLLLVETAKHVDAPSYEILCEAVFGKWGWFLCNLNMFFMSWGPMLSYMMIVKDTLGKVFGFVGTQAQKNALIFSSFTIMLPLSLQRDMADLAKTSRVCVVFDAVLVAIIAWFSPTATSISNSGGIMKILSSSSFRPNTCFIGLGIISFAFSCQHSSLIIAGSLKNPTRHRWQSVTISALGICSILAIIMGSFGYLGFLESTEGDIFNNFPMPYEVNDQNDLARAKAANVARGVLCGIMFFVYPLESFVARHVIMTNLFRGREAHEGDDHTVLDRWDRRIATTILLFFSVLIPALHCSDVGLVLAWTGTVAATCLSYILPGLLFIGVHGQQFLDLVGNKWGHSIDSTLSSKRFDPFDCICWYAMLIPIWCRIASTGNKGLAFHNERKARQTPAQSYRLGKIKHNIRLQKNCLQAQHLCNECDSNAETSLGNKYGTMLSSIGEEDDPQDETQSLASFLVAIGFVLFGVISLLSGILSILCETAGYD